MRIARDGTVHRSAATCGPWSRSAVVHAVAVNSPHGMEVAEALVLFARRLSSDVTVEAVLKDLSDVAADLLDVDGIGVLLSEDGDLTVATTKSPEGRRVEQLEVTLGEGPCVEAARTGQEVRATDLREWVDRYPRFAPAALDMGIHSIHAVPLTGHGSVFGALDIVNRAPVELPDANVAVARMLADTAVSYILAARLYEEASLLAGQLQRALDTRVIVEQAKGVLAERHGVTMAEAFERIRSYARGTNRRTPEVAHDVVDGSLLL